MNTPRADCKHVQVYCDHLSDDLIVVLDKQRKVRLSEGEFRRYAREHFPLLSPIPSYQRGRAWPAYLRSKGVPQWAIDLRPDARRNLHG
jgi:hypothetical protein